MSVSVGCGGGGRPSGNVSVGVGPLLPAVASVASGGIAAGVSGMMSAPFLASAAVALAATEGARSWMEYQDVDGTPLLPHHFTIDNYSIMRILEDEALRGVCLRIEERTAREGGKYYRAIDSGYRAFMNTCVQELETAGLSSTADYFKTLHRNRYYRRWLKDLTNSALRHDAEGALEKCLERIANKSKGGSLYRVREAWDGFLERNFPQATAERLDDAAERTLSVASVTLTTAGYMALICFILKNAEDLKLSSEAVKWLTVTFAMFCVAAGPYPVIRTTVVGSTLLYFMVKTVFDVQQGVPSTLANSLSSWVEEEMSKAQQRRTNQ